MACSATGANRDLAIVEEQIFKVTPANPFFKYLRTTGDSLKGTIETQESAELRKGRQTSAPVMGRSSSGGDINIELSYRSFDELFEALMYGDWLPDTAATLAGAAVPGQRKLVIGNNARSFTIEKFFSDIEMYRRYRGVMVGGFNLSVPMDGKVTGSFNLMGVNNPKGEDDGIITGAVYDPETPNTTDQFTSFIGNLQLTDKNGIVSTIGYATQLDIAVSNNLKQDNALFTKEAYCISPGQFKVTGTLGMYLKDKTYLNAHIDWDTLKMAVLLTDPAGNSYQIDLGALKLTDAPDGVSGPDTITMAMPFTAFGPDAFSITKIPTVAEDRVHMPILTRTGTTAATTAVAMAANPDDIDDNLLVGAEVSFEIIKEGTADTKEIIRVTVDTPAIAAGNMALTIRGVAGTGAGLAIAAGASAKTIAAQIAALTFTGGYVATLKDNYVTFVAPAVGVASGVNSFTTVATLPVVIRYTDNGVAPVLVTDGAAAPIALGALAAGTHIIQARAFPPAGGPASPSPVVTETYIVLA